MVHLSVLVIGTVGWFVRRLSGDVPPVRVPEASLRLIRAVHFLLERVAQRSAGSVALLRGRDQGGLRAAGIVCPVLRCDSGWAKGQYQVAEDHVSVHLSPTVSVL